MQNKTWGFILIATLIFLFVMTLLAMSGAETMIFEHNMQSQQQRELSVLLRADAGIQQVILTKLGDTIILPPSTIILSTNKKIVSTDACGNQTWDISATAQNANVRVVLNSEDIFAKVPVSPGCKIIPTHQVLWFKIG